MLRSTVCRNLWTEFLFRREENEVGEDNETGSRHKYQKNWGSVLELGTATGVLSICLALSCTPKKENGPSGYDDSLHVCTDIVTSDVEDELGDIKENLKYNFEINQFVSKKDDLDDTKRGIMPIHVPHTWGTGWKAAASRMGISNKKFNTIIASDILLYVSAYGALVSTLKEIFNDNCYENPVFVMSWNRRMKESKEFFDRMNDVGFKCVHKGKCVYSFTL
mmetsp:Transcript_13352/g.19093  ORF Transcript_13352/g.19093 Transcript_13352/m.19093 type:complete len:221 (+) Transcript_13352:157-819(+)